MYYAQKWHQCFAWRPVRAIDGSLLWLRAIERRGCEDKGGRWTEYRKPFKAPRDLPQHPLAQGEPPCSTKCALVIGIAIVLLALLIGCDAYTSGHFSRRWSEEKIEAWKTEAREKCKPKGQALDRGSSGYSYMSEILECPDGTLRIVPLD